MEKPKKSNSADERSLGKIVLFFFPAFALCEAKAERVKNTFHVIDCRKIIDKKYCGQTKRKKTLTPRDTLFSTCSRLC